MVNCPEYVEVLAAHTVGATVPPAIWPAPILKEGDDLAFDILGVAPPNPGSDLTVVIQT